MYSKFLIEHITHSVINSSNSFKHVYQVSARKLLLFFNVALPVILFCSLGHRAFTLQLCSLLENVLSALLSLMSFAPWGSLQLVTCKVDKLSDWYTLLHNPSPYYKQTLHCSQEAVYPL